MDVVEVNTIFDSVIVAHVISRLAGEEWRLEVFRTHGKIYKASASQWFGVPIDLIKMATTNMPSGKKARLQSLHTNVMQPGTPTMIDILTENEILAMMEEFRENPQNFRFVA